MKTDFQKIKQELERLYKEATSSTNLMFLERVPRYFDFIAKTPNLEAIMLEDKKHREARIRDKTDKGLDFMFWPLYRDMQLMIDKLTKKEGFGSPSLRRTVFQKILKLMGLEKSESERLLPKYRGALKLFHTQLLDRIAEQEFGYTDIVIPSEVVKALGLTQESKWQDLTIIFTHEFEVGIRYKEKTEFKTNHERMGFADERRKSSTKAVESWQLLQMLAALDGKIPFSSLRPKEREQRKKSKQELGSILKKYFQIQEDPFFKVNKGVGEYQIKIKLIPLLEFREQWRDRKLSDTNKPIHLKSKEFLRPTSDL